MNATIEEPGSSPPPPSQPVNRVGWWIHLVLVGGYFAIHIPVTFLHLRRGPMLTDNTRGLLVVIFVELAFFGLVFMVGCLASRASREDLLLRWRPGWWTVPLGIGYSVAIRFALGLFFVLIIAVLLVSRVIDTGSVQNFTTANRPDVEKLVDVAALKNDRFYFWITLTLGSFVVAGLREELWRSGTLAAMRALWPNKFASRGGQVFAIMLIAVVFGAGHLAMGVIAAIFAGFLGVCLGVIMIGHRSIWPAVIAHGFFDATTFALLPYLLDYLPRV